MAIFNITINSYINQPPNIIGDLSINATEEQSYIFTLEDFTINTLPTYSDPEGDVLNSIKIISLPSVGVLRFNNIDVTSAGLEITASQLIAGNLSYFVPSSPTIFIDSFTYQASDIGSLTFANITGSVDITIFLKPNEPPTEVGDGNFTIDHGQTLIFTSAMFTTLTTPLYSDPEGDPAYQLRITSLPAEGILKLDNLDININDIVNFSDIDLGLLTFVPDNTDLNANFQTFNFEIADSGSNIFVA